MPNHSLFGQLIDSHDSLRALIPQPSPLVQKKVITHIDHHIRAFIAACPYAVPATANARGESDSSPRGGAPGFIHVLDAHHLLLPEATGNRRADTICNLLENPNIDILLHIPGYSETLRLNGTAVVTQDATLLSAYPVNAKTPPLALGIRVRECYVHCAKAAIRSGLWTPRKWPDTSHLPSAAEMLRDHTQATQGDGSIAHIQALLDESYTQRL